METKLELTTELQNNQKSLYSGGHGKALAAYVASLDSSNFSYLLKWIPEQAEDIYLLMTASNEIVEIEVQRDNGKITSIINFDVDAFSSARTLDSKTRMKIDIVRNELNKPHTDRKQ